MDQSIFNELLQKEIQRMCQLAIDEDLAGNDSIDITAELIGKDINASAVLISREDAILCGIQWFEKVFQLLGGQVQLNWLVNEGEHISAGQEICHLAGNARQMLTGERSAMNFLQSLSATATVTKKFVETINNPNCQLLDTRKTIPGMRFGQKYAVACGGGTNHRMGLNDAYLIKENHIIACGGIKNALSKAIDANPSKLLEIEVETLDELQQAIEGKAQVIMLDNFNNEKLLQAVKKRSQSTEKPKLEASGNVNLSTISDIAATGVDYISVGALTKDIKAVDLSLRVQLM